MSEYPEAPFSYTEKTNTGHLLTVRGRDIEEFTDNLKQVFGDEKSAVLTLQFAGMATQIPGPAAVVSQPAAAPATNGGSNNFGDRVLGADEDTGRTLTVKNGKHGWYVTDGETNANLFSEDDPATVGAGRGTVLIRKKKEWAAKKAQR